jgi:hypothetical protein
MREGSKKLGVQLHPRGVCVSQYSGAKISIPAVQSPKIER